MLRGAIEYHDGETIAGWIHSAAGSLRDAVVLAFVDDRCIGAGKIDIFRRDLADAGLGDGYCGFRFAVSPPPGTAAARVVVKLDQSDFLLLQRAAMVVDPQANAATARDVPPHSLAAIDWMQRRRWIDQIGADFLRQTTALGLYNRALRDVGRDPINPEAEAKRLFELYRRGPVRVQESLIALCNLERERGPLIDGAALPLIAVLAPRGEIELREFPFARPDRGGAATRLQCRDDRLLFLDARASLTASSAESARVFRAV